MYSKIESNSMKRAQPKVYEIAHIRQIAGIAAVQDMIKSYAFHDETSKTFREKMAEKLHPVTQEIKKAHSRANRFGELDLDEDDPHWTYTADNDTIYMQAVNCPICGEYQAYNSYYDYNIPHCNFNYEFYGLDIDAHYTQQDDEAHNINSFDSDIYDSHDESEEEDYDY
jgi:hypothetical protein